MDLCNRLRKSSKNLNWIAKNGFKIVVKTNFQLDIGLNDNL